MSNLTIRQQTNHHGFPKAAELIEILGGHPLEAADRAMFNQLLQIAHDSGRLVEPDAEWEITFAHLRQAQSKHESNDRLRESIRRIRRVEVKVTYVSARTGEVRTLETNLLEFTDTSDDEFVRCDSSIRDTEAAPSGPGPLQPMGQDPLRGRLCDDQQVRDLAL